MESYIYIQTQRTWTQCLHGPDHVNEKFFLDMVFNKVQFSHLVINEYVQLWYQLLIQIILYHGNPNWKLLISWLYTILITHEGWVISYFADSGLYVFRLFKQHVTGLQFLWNFTCLFLIHKEFVCAEMVSWQESEHGKIADNIWMNT